MNYHQLTREERYQIKMLLKTGQNQSEIAIAIGVNKSTISRELVRNRGSEAIDLNKPMIWQMPDAEKR